MFSLKVHRSGSDTERFLEDLKHLQIESILHRYAEVGVKALESATPKDSGKTAASWSYEIVQDSTGYSINWFNDNYNKGFNVAINLQKGHGTGTGGYVKGIDYINPAMAPVFEQIANDAWNEVTNG